MNIYRQVVSVLLYLFLEHTYEMTCEYVTFCPVLAMGLLNTGGPPFLNRRLAIQVVSPDKACLPRIMSGFSLLVFLRPYCVEVTCFI